jgi:hypothetical protein
MRHAVLNDKEEDRVRSTLHRSQLGNRCFSVEALYTDASRALEGAPSTQALPLLAAQAWGAGSEASPFHQHVAGRARLFPWYRYDREEGQTLQVLGDAYRLRVYPQNKNDGVSSFSSTSLAWNAAGIVSHGVSGGALAPVPACTGKR